MPVGKFEDKDSEPPVPPGLETLDEPLRALADFFGIRADLIAAAAEHSEPLEARSLSTEALARWVGELSLADKDALLVSILTEETVHRTRYQLQLLRQRARREFEAASPATSSAASGLRRTAGELLARSQALAERRRREQAARQAREAAEREAEVAKRRKLHLQALRGAEQPLWTQVDQLIDTRQAKSYDRAVSLLEDLRDLAAMGEEAEAFTRRVQGLVAQHTKSRR